MPINPSQANINANNAFYGMPDNIKCGGSGIGYCENAVANFIVTKSSQKAKNPLRIIKQFIDELGGSFEADLLQSDLKNVLLARGIRNNTIHNVEDTVNTTYWLTYVTRANETVYALNSYIEPATLNGCLYKITNVGSSPYKSGIAPPTYPTTPGETVTDGDLTLTCVAYPVESETMKAYNDATDMNYAQLTGYNFKANTDIIVYKSDLLTKYTIGDDYWFDLVTGKIVQNPDGDIGDTDTLKVINKFTPIKWQLLYNDPDSFILEQCDFEFLFTNKSTGELFAIEYGLFQPSGNCTIAMNEAGKRSTIKFSGKPLQDTNNPDYEFGKIIFYKN